MATIKLKNTYELSPEYTMSGRDFECFDIDDSGNLTWKKDHINTTNLKTFDLTVTATTASTDLYNIAEASIDITIKIKQRIRRCQKATPTHLICWNK